tara:strand:+ start:682 stop:828 length:147 start_codon:yes stop_codon:yes gene_type:complete
MPKKAKPNTKPKKAKGTKKSTKKGRCWSGYKPTPGKKAYSSGSCMKKK